MAGFCATKEQDRRNNTEYTRKKRWAEARKRVIISDVFNHIQKLRHQGKDVERWLDCLSRLTGIPRESRNYIVF